MNFTISATLKSLGGNKNALYGICIGRNGGYEAIQPLLCDRYNRYFQFLLSGNGKLVIRKVDMLRTDYVPAIGTLLAEKDLSADFAPETAKKMSVKRRWTTWEVYLNDKLVYSFDDASIGILNKGCLLVEPGAKISLAEPSIFVYEKGPEPVFPVPDSLASCLSGQKSCFNNRYNYKFCIEPGEEVEEDRIDTGVVKNCRDYRIKISYSQKRAESKVSENEFLYPIVLRGMDTLAAMESFEAFSLSILKEQGFHYELKSPDTKNLDSDPHRLVLSRNYRCQNAEGATTILCFNYYFWGSKNMDALCSTYLSDERHEGVNKLDAYVRMYSVRDY
jgi:hypothetical protein